MYKVRLGGTFEVEGPSGTLSAPPNRTIATLFLGLLARGESWSGRDDVAQLLYPSSEMTSARTAFRQSLVRLRKWIGDASVELGRDCLRLKPDVFSIDLTLPDGSPAPPPLIAPGLNHPWADYVRSQWRPLPKVADDTPGLQFCRTVLDVATLDRDCGRSLLVGGWELAQLVTPIEISEMLNATRPNDRRDPHACEHLMMRGTFLYWVGAIREACETYMKAARIARLQRDSGLSYHARAFVLFGLVESGEMGAAADWIKRLSAEESRRSQSLLQLNALGAYHWNNGEVATAIDIYSKAQRHIPGANRMQKLHFWTNFAVLLAEAGMSEDCQAAAATAHEHLNPRVDKHSALTLDFAEATRLMQDQPGRAAQILERMCAESTKIGWTMSELYAQEALAEAYALCRQSALAHQTWQRAEALRKRFSGRLTPRLQARKARIRQAVSA
jgi:tetratricopeptide (TPR) repeat protein